MYVFIKFNNRNVSVIYDKLILLNMLTKITVTFTL